MVRRLHIRGYKSLEDIEVILPRLAILFGPNATGKSNFLDALLLMSKVATSRTLKEAFDAPHRGKPIESFTFGNDGIRGLLGKDRLSFSMEVDMELSEAVVGAVDRQVEEMRSPSGNRPLRKSVSAFPRVRERLLRYRIEIEMIPKTGFLRVADEYLAPLNKNGQPKGSRKPFIQRHEDKIHLRREGQAHPIYFDRWLDHSILSLPHYVPHYPHLEAARRELESWLFFYFEPREQMRATNPVKEVRHIGSMGEELAAFLNTMEATNARQFEAINKALHALIPSVEGVSVEISDLGEVELKLVENGISFPARVLSEGTLRMLGLLSLIGAGGEAPALIGFEEPENGVHPRRIELIAEILKNQEALGRTQYIVTTHSAVLLDLMRQDSLLVATRAGRKTRIDPFSAWGPLGRKAAVDKALSDSQESLQVSERILRGDFDV